MNTYLKKTAVLLCAVLLLPFAGCSGKQEPEMMDTTVSVETAPVSRGTLSSSSTYIGTVSAEGTASVVSLVAGTVDHVAVSMGDTVSAGDLLCSFDDESARLTLNSAVASLGSAQAGLDSALKGYDSSVASYGGEDMSVLESQVQTAKENYEATKALFDIGAASRLEVDQALQAYNSASAGLEAARNGLRASQSGIDSARAGVEAAQAGVAAAEYQLSLYNITSPISGVVESVNVIANNFSPSGTVAFVISNANNKTVTFYVTDEVMKCISVGQAVTVSAGAAEYSGAVSEISGIVDQQTGLFRIKALIDDAKDLPDGLSVSVTTVSAKAENSVIVPSDSLYFDDGIAFVYTVKDNTAHRTDVSVSLYTKESTAISSGLSDEDVIVTSWSSALKDGAPLNIASAGEQNTDNGNASGEDAE